MRHHRGCGPRHNWRGEFNRCGFRFTVPREAVIELLHKTDKHLSAEDIYVVIHKKNPQVGLTTIYRTLELLVNMGLVHKLDFGDRRARFEIALTSQEEGHHHHLVCTGCNKVVEYTDFIDDELELLSRIEAALGKKYDFTITNHLIQFYGLCETCAARQ